MYFRVYNRIKSRLLSFWGGKFSTILKADFSSLTFVTLWSGSKGSKIGGSSTTTEGFKETARLPLRMACRGWFLRLVVRIMRGGAIFSARSATRDKMVPIRFSFSHVLSPLSPPIVLRQPERPPWTSCQPNVPHTLAFSRCTNSDVPLDFSISRNVYAFLGEHWTYLFLSNQIFQKIKNSRSN